MSAVCRPYISRISAVCQPSVSRLSAVYQPYVSRISAVCQPSVSRGTAVCQPYVRRISAVCPPYVSRISAVCQPYLFSQYAASFNLLTRGKLIGRNEMNHGSLQTKNKNMTWPAYWLNFLSPETKTSSYRRPDFSACTEGGQIDINYLHYSIFPESSSGLLTIWATISLDFSRKSYWYYNPIYVRCPARGL